jgi:hypothetical protein
VRDSVTQWFKAQMVALRQGSLRPNSVFARYRVKDGYVSSMGPFAQPIREYFPISTPGLPFALAKLAEGDEQKVIDFVGKYGLMGYSPERTLDAPLPVFRGDPLPWLWAHARGIRTVLAIYDYWKNESEVGLNAYMQSLTGDFFRKPDGRFVLTVGSPSAVAELSVTREPGEPLSHYTFCVRAGDEERETVLAGEQLVPSLIAQNLITTIVNENLRGASRVLWPFGDPVTSLFNIEAPITAAYWHLADVVTNGQIRKCERCGAFFKVTDARQRFCPPEEGILGATGSPCGSQARQARLRSRRKQD